MSAQVGQLRELERELIYGLFVQDLRWETARTSQIPAHIQRNCKLDRRVSLMYGEFAAYVGPYIGYARKSPVDELVNNERGKCRGEEYLREYGSGRS